MPTESGPSQPSPEIRPAQSPSKSGQAPRAMSRSRMALAVAVLGAFAAFTWYAYERVGEPGGEAIAPLIKADKGPTRVRPESPGGMEIPYQDKMIYEELSRGEPEPGVERLLPPPEVPLPPPTSTAGVPPQAGPGSAHVETLVGTFPPPAQPVAPPDVQAEPAPTPTPSQAETVTAVEPAPAPTAGPGVAKLPPSGPEEDAEAPGGAQSVPAAQAGSDEAAPATPKPSAKSQQKGPEDTAVAALSSPPAGQAPAAGGHRIQVAAVRSREGAERGWRRLQKAHADVLGPLTLTVEKVDLGSKGIFYRIQGGPLTQQAAAEACAELKRRKTGCFVVGP